MTSKETAKARYLSMVELRLLLGITNKRTLERLREADRLLDPDVFVGPAPGWLPVRGFLFGLHTGRLTYDARPIPHRGGRPRKEDDEVELPAWWRVANPVHYLESYGAAERLGVKPNSVYLLRNNGTFQQPDVVIGDPAAGRQSARYGWLPETIDWFARKTGRTTIQLPQ